MLNGTSSVLYGTVPELAPSGHEARAFWFFYTVTIGADAVAPTLYGGVADAVGLSGSFLLVTVVVLLILPLLLCFDPPSKSTDNEGVRRTAYVRFWHKADVPHRVSNVRFRG